MIVVCEEMCSAYRNERASLLTRWWRPPASWRLRSDSQRSPWAAGPAASCCQWPDRSRWKRRPVPKHWPRQMNRPQAPSPPRSPVVDNTFEDALYERSKPRFGTSHVRRGGWDLLDPCLQGNMNRVLHHPPPLRLLVFPACLIITHLRGVQQPAHVHRQARIYPTVGVVDIQGRWQVSCVQNPLVRSFVLQERENKKRGQGGLGWSKIKTIVIWREMWQTTEILLKPHVWNGPHRLTCLKQASTRFGGNMFLEHNRQ